METLNALKESYPILHILYDPSSDWFEFENEFEEGWTDNPEIPTLVNRLHHLITSAWVATFLKKKYQTFQKFNTIYQFEDFDKELGRLYYAVAKSLYPEERIYWGNEQEAYWEARNLK